MLGFRYTNFGECLNILRCRAFPTSTSYIQFLVVLKGIISLFSKYIEYLLKRCYPSPTYRRWENFTLFIKNYEKCQTFQEHMDYFKNNINLMHKYSDKHYIHLVLDFAGIDSHGRPTYREYSKFFHRSYFKCTDLKKG